MPLVTVPSLLGLPPTLETAKLDPPSQRTHALSSAFRIADRSRQIFTETAKAARVFQLCLVAEYGPDEAAQILRELADEIEELARSTSVSRSLWAGFRTGLRHPFAMSGSNCGAAEWLVVELRALRAANSDSATTNRPARAGEERSRPENRWQLLLAARMAGSRRRCSYSRRFTARHRWFATIRRDWSRCFAHCAAGFTTMRRRWLSLTSRTQRQRLQTTRLQ